MIRTRRFWLGIGFSVFLLAMFLFTIDLGRMAEALANANYVFLIPGIAMYLLSMLCRALRWRVLLEHLKPISVTRLFPAVIVGYMANSLLPMRLGELVRCYYLGQREDISKTSTFATILSERVLDALTLILIIGVMAAFVPLGGLAEAFGERSGVPWLLLVVALSVPFLFAFGTLLMLAIYAARARSLASVLVGLLPERAETPLLALIELFLVGLAPLRHPRKLAVLLLLTIPIWVSEASLFFFIGFVFNLNQVYANLGEMIVATLLVTSIADLGSAVPGAPGGTGLFELVARETLVYLPFGEVDRAIAGAYAVVVHAASALPVICLGLIIIWTHHLSLNRLAGVEPGIAEEPGIDGQPVVLSNEDRQG
ncbi:MAG: lysylphosphatidylglycerol synthase transmembrane domain-containing protein [Dehalococcoidia bacterium]